MDEPTTTSDLSSGNNSGSWRAGVHWRRMQPARWPILTLASSFVFVLCFLCPMHGRAQTQIIQPMASTPRAGEVDTADRGGQAGGKSLGINYQLSALRCGAGQAIVGANLRRGDVLDFLQVACATPVCNGGELPVGCGAMGSFGRQSIWRRRPSADDVRAKSSGFRLPWSRRLFLYPKIRFRRRHRDRVLADCRCPHRARLRPGSIRRHPDRLQWASRRSDLASPRGRPLAGYDHPALAHELHNPHHLLRASRMGSYSLLPRDIGFCLLARSSGGLALLPRRAPFVCFHRHQPVRPNAD